MPPPVQARTPTDGRGNWDRIAVPSCSTLHPLNPQPSTLNPEPAVEVGLRAQRDHLQVQVGQRDRELDLAAQREADLQVHIELTVHL